MSKTLDEIRKKLLALDAKKGGNTNAQSGDRATYAHWNIEEGTSATLRFLPDGNEDNTFFWVERQLIKLPFPGVLGQDETKPVIVQVPCIEMWEGKNTCPILNEVRPMWKDKTLEDLARKYWIKRTYYMQGFVKSSPMAENEVPENPIRKFIMGPQIFAIIKAALMDPDMEHSPVDIINGTDFIVSKTSKGGFADYGTSKWARKESSLSEEHQAAIAQYGLVDLASYLPKKPTPEQLSAMFEMFQASIDGQLYDPARWAQFYKPNGYDSSADDGGEGRRAQRPVSRPVQPTPKPEVTIESSSDLDVEVAPTTKSVSMVEETVEPKADKPTTGKTAAEILAMIKNRNGK